MLVAIVCVSVEIVAVGRTAELEHLLDPTFPLPKVDRYSVRIYRKVIQ